MEQIEVYGRDWCEDTTASREVLDGLGVPYRYIDIERDAAASKWVEQQNGGKLKTPTISVKDRVLVEPDEAELRRLLLEQGFVQADIARRR